MTFRGGVVLKPDRLQPGTFPVESLPIPPSVSIPLLQHAGGTPARPIVKPGDSVTTGQMIGEACDDSSAPVHASICGTVTKLDRFPYAPGRTAFSVVVEHDGREEFSSPIPYSKPWTEADPPELIRAIALSGITDGSAAAHAKLTEAAGAGIDTLIINAVTDEPYLSSDCRLIIDNAEKMLTGVLIGKKITGASQCLIALNDTASDLVAALAEKMADERYKTLSLAKVKRKYPQHDERLLIRACTGKEIPSNVSAARAGSVVLGAPAAVYLRDAVMECIPWYQRIVTVAGPLVGSPKNLLVRIGTPLRTLLEACSADLSRIKKLVLGGPLSGSTCHDIDAPVVKSTSAILLFAASITTLKSKACISCGRCVSACPMRLSPSFLAALVLRGDLAQAANSSLKECIACGCCSYVCPSKIDLVHLLEFGQLQCRLIGQATLQRSVA
jgi:electron transport complex protein RnfC